MAPSPTLFTLPVELQKDIIDLLPYPTLQVLHAPHRHLRTLIDFQRIQALTSRCDIMEELAEAARSDAFLLPKASLPAQIVYVFYRRIILPTKRGGRRLLMPGSASSAV